MNLLDLSRWQFGITTVYHFLFVPLTIGMAFFVAAFETAWVRSGNARWLRLTRFYGQLFLINFAMGVVTGIVQEFQFGMNWSAYSRFVGDIFGAPLAFEALLAFFLESTFLGLWIFGWDRLPRSLHLACIWIVAVATTLSAYFILAANSWMQHPVGFRYNPVTHRAELSDFGAVLTNPTQIAAFLHTIAASILTGAGLIAGVAMWHIMRRPPAPARATVPQGADRPGAAKKPSVPESLAAFYSAARAGTITAALAGVAMLATGDRLAKIMVSYQPMKMAAAEALYHTAQPAPFSLFTVGTLNGSRPVFSVTLPRLLSFLATGTFSGKVQGIDNLQAQYAQMYGPGSYTPVIPVTYWAYRLMIGAGLLAAVIAVAALWAIRRGRRPRTRWLLWPVLAVPLLPLAANSFGWIFTEMGRQPWLVFGQLKTASGVSANAAGEVLTSLIVFTVLYGVLAVVEAGLMLRYARAGLEGEHAGAGPDEGDSLAFGY
jgi:cytochrome d ubiquinol oxidase subunit I